MSKQETKKLKEIKYTTEFVGDSSKLYGEDFLKDEKGELVIDPITKKPVAASFMETHGDRIFDILSEAASEKADSIEDTLKDFEELKDFNLSDHVDTTFESQESSLSQQIAKEQEEYKGSLEDFEKSLADQEKKLNDVTEKFNSCEDKEEKIKLYHEVHEEMNILIGLASNYGKVVEKSDTSSVIDSLSAYDENYDESSTRKYIKDV